MSIFERTRFLSDLDTMLMRDRRGAIHDMLQVLRENGVIKAAFAEEVMDDRRLGMQGYRDHCKRRAELNICHFLSDARALEYSEEAGQPGTTRLRATAFFVAKV